MPTSNKPRKKLNKRNHSGKLSRKNAHKRCEKVTGKTIINIEFPGGRSRESWRVIFEGKESVIATRRREKFRADLEIRVLKALEKHDVPSPKLIATTDWKLFLQEDLKGERLSKELMFADEATTEKLLDSALNGLSQAQKAASEELLDLQMPMIGARKDWILELLERPYPIADFFEVPAPKLDMKALYQTLRVKHPRFIKWDSRPGNAVVQPDGVVAWYDWEHAGSRNRLDDVAWLLTDEFVPDYPKAEEYLLNKYLPDFADHKSIEEAKSYLMIYGTFHMLIRLGLILDNKGKKEWWDIDYCIEKDKVGITLDCAQRTCLRASRWAQHSPLTKELSPWLKKIHKKLETL